jgi:hypothetical protein
MAKLLQYRYDDEEFATIANPFTESTGRNLKIPRYQSVVNSGADTFYTIPIEPAASTSAISNELLVYYD